MKISHRRCIGCRKRATKAELVRLAVQDGVVVVDKLGKVQSRGAYVHRCESCLNAMMNSKAIAHALRVAKGADLVSKDELSLVRERLRRVCVEELQKLSQKRILLDSSDKNVLARILEDAVRAINL